MQGRTTGRFGVLLLCSFFLKEGPPNCINPDPFLVSLPMLGQLLFLLRPWCPPAPGSQAQLCALHSGPAHSLYFDQLPGGDPCTPRPSGPRETVLSKLTMTLPNDSFSLKPLPCLSSLANRCPNSLHLPIAAPHHFPVQGSVLSHFSALSFLPCRALMKPHRFGTCAIQEP